MRIVIRRMRHLLPEYGPAVRLWEVSPGRPSLHFLLDCTSGGLLGFIRSALCSAHPAEALAQLLCKKELAARRRRTGLPSLARFRLCVALSEGGFSSVGHLDPLRVRRGLGV